MPRGEHHREDDDRTGSSDGENRSVLVGVAGKRNWSDWRRTYGSSIVGQEALGR